MLVTISSPYQTVTFSPLAISSFNQCCSHLVILLTYYPGSKMTLVFQALSALNLMYILHVPTYRLLCIYPMLHLLISNSNLTLSNLSVWIHYKTTISSANPTLLFFLLVSLLHMWIYLLFLLSLQHICSLRGGGS